MATSVIKKFLKEESVTTTTATTVAANGGVAWIQVPLPSSGKPVSISGYYLDGGSGCSVYAMYLTPSYASFAVRNNSSTNANVKITAHYLCLVGGVVRKLLNSLQTLSFRAERGWA